MPYSLFKNPTRKTLWSGCEVKQTNRDTVPPIPLDKLLMTGESRSIFKCLPALEIVKKRHQDIRKEKDRETKKITKN